MTSPTRQDFDHVEQVVQNSKSSFAMGMKVLPANRRGYLFAIYAYCRVLDDIADEEGAQEDKLKALDKWRHKIDRMINGQPDCAITRVLAHGVKKYNLPCDEFYKLIDGMMADAKGPIQRPTWDELYRYCRCVAVSVGLLSLPLFGRNDQAAQNFAVELGYALQLTNILRDVAEDWQINRLYLPAESLVKHQVDDLSSQHLSKVLKDVAVRAENHYAAAESFIKKNGSSLRNTILTKNVALGEVSVNVAQ